MSSVNGIDSNGVSPVFNEGMVESSCIDEFSFSKFFGELKKNPPQARVKTVAQSLFCAFLKEKDLPFESAESSRLAINFYFKVLKLFPPGYIDENILNAFKENSANCLRPVDIPFKLFFQYYFGGFGYSGASWEITCLAEKVACRIKSLNPGEKLTVPLGFMRLRECHAMLGLFERLPNGNFVFVVTNSGAGIVFHGGFRLEKNPESIVKNKSYGYLEFKDIPEEKLFVGGSNVFFESLFSHYFLKHSNNYKVGSLYQGPIAYLKDYLSSEVRTPTKAQTNGSCATYCVKALLRYLFKDDVKKYKRIQLAIRLAAFYSMLSREDSFFLPSTKTRFIELGAERILKRAKKENKQGNLSQSELELILSFVEEIKLEAKVRQPESNDEALFPENNQVGEKELTSLLYHKVQKGDFDAAQGLLETLKGKNLSPEALDYIKKVVLWLHQQPQTPDRVIFTLSLCALYISYVSQQKINLSKQNDKLFFKAAADAYFSCFFYNLSSKANPNLMPSIEECLRVTTSLLENGDNTNYLIKMKEFFTSYLESKEPSLESRSFITGLKPFDCKKPLLENGITTYLLPSNSKKAEECELLTIRDRYALNFWNIYQLASSNQHGCRKILRFTLENHILPHLQESEENLTNLTKEELFFLLRILRLDYASVRNLPDPLEVYAFYSDLTTKEKSQKWLKMVYQTLEEMERRGDKVVLIA